MCNLTTIVLSYLMLLFSLCMYKVNTYKILTIWPKASHARLFRTQRLRKFQAISLELNKSLF
jgi:hypothetical protein